MNIDCDFRAPCPGHHAAKARIRELDAEVERLRAALVRARRQIHEPSSLRAENRRLREEAQVSENEMSDYPITIDGIRWVLEDDVKKLRVENAAAVARVRADAFEEAARIVESQWKAPFHRFKIAAAIRARASGEAKGEDNANFS